jgi:hypothetical protein
MPKYHCNSLEGYAVSLVSGSQANGSTLATDTVAQPWATGEADTMAHTDPAYAFVNTATVKDARTVAACIDLTFTGRADAASGTITKISNLKLSSIWRTSLLGTTFVPYSTDQLYEQGGISYRPGQTLQVRAAPDFTDTEFVPASHSPILEGSPAVTATTCDSDHIRNEDPAMCGYVIRAGTDTQTYTLKFTKVVEYREEDLVFGLGSVSSAVATTPPTAGVTPIRRAADKLNKSVPTWPTSDDIVSGLRQVTGVAQFAKSATGLYSGLKRAVAGVSVLPRMIGPLPYMLP